MFSNEKLARERKATTHFSFSQVIAQFRKNLVTPFPIDAPITPIELKRLQFNLYILVKRKRIWRQNLTVLFSA